MNMKNYKILCLMCVFSMYLNARNFSDVNKDNGIKIISDRFNVDNVFNSTTVFSGEYFSNKLPENGAILFAEGLIDPKKHQFHSAPVFSPDYSEMYFSLYLNYDDPQCIFVSKKENGIWQRPEIAEFSGQYPDGRPIISPDGNTLYFYSKRPLEPGAPLSENSMIWFVKKEKYKWSSPQLLSLNSRLGVAFYPDHYAGDGLFYFSVKVNSTNYDIYQCEMNNDRPVNISKIEAPVSLENSVELGAVTNPENTILIFQSNNRMNENGAVLYLCRKMANGKWGKPEPISKKINNRTTRFASFTRDGKYFFFTSLKSGVEEIYWIKTTDLNTEN